MRSRAGDEQLPISTSDGSHRSVAAPAFGSPAFPALSRAALGPLDPPTRARALLAIQRSHGNAAVQRLLGARRTSARAGPAPRLVARYEAGEHAQMGADRTVKVNGVPMTEGEMIAVGDFYATAEDMMKADPAELERLRDLIRRDQDAMMGFPGVKPVTTAEWDAATPGRPKGKTYLDLLEDNEGHFAPPSGGGGGLGADHRSLFETNHRAALGKAHAEAKKSKTVPDEAVALNGFACHFLTDAFSAGHLFNKDEMIARAREEWNRIDEWGPDVENDFTRGVGAAVLSNRKAAAKLAPFELKLDTWGPVTADRFSMFLYMTASWEPEKFFNVIINLVHDRLDASISDPAQAIEVQNARGDRWKLSGDKTLGQSPDTLRISREAVAASFRNLEQAAKTPDALGDDAMVQSVWNYTPKPTDAGAVNMEAVISSALTYASAPTINAFAAKTIENLDVGIAELVKRGYMRKRQGATPTPPGTPAPLPQPVP